MLREFKTLEFEIMRRKQPSATKPSPRQVTATIKKDEVPQLKSAEKVVQKQSLIEKKPEKPQDEAMSSSNESINENTGSGASNTFFTGFKGLFKRVIGATTNEMGQRSEEKGQHREIINPDTTVETPSFNIEDGNLNQVQKEEDEKLHE